MPFNGTLSSLPFIPFLPYRLISLAYRSTTSSWYHYKYTRQSNTQQEGLTLELDVERIPQGLIKLDHDHDYPVRDSNGLYFVVWEAMYHSPSRAHPLFTLLLTLIFILAKVLKQVISDCNLRCDATPHPLTGAVLYFLYLSFPHMTSMTTIIFDPILERDHHWLL